MQLPALIADQLVLALLPDETLYSLAARFHCVSGGNTPAATGKLLFGYRLAGMHHDFTGHVLPLSNRMMLESPHNAVLRHTVLPVYLPFHSAERCQNWIDRLLAGSPGGMKAEMGLLASRFGASHPLKACAQCADQDTQAFGTSYWHVEHQLPGVTACRTHRSVLMHSPIKVSGEDRFAWLMPTEARLQLPRTTVASGVALSLAEIALGLWNLPIDAVIDQEILRRTYLTAAHEQGLTDFRTGRFDFQAFRNRLSEVVDRSNLEEYEPWLAEGKAGEALAPRFVRMFHSTNPRQMRHPLNHMILILALFTEWPTFWGAYQVHLQNALNRVDEVGGKVLDEPLNNRQSGRPDGQVRLAKLVRSGSSVRAAAHTLGISTNTAIAWLASEGIATKTRPKVLVPQLRRLACVLLQRGEDKTKVADAVGVSLQAITRLLFAEPGLHECWRAARFSKAQTKARKDWTATMQSCPDASSNEWRMLAPAAYAWLYRHDRNWLADSIRNRNISVRRRSTRVNWVLRDERIESAIFLAVQSGIQSDRQPKSYSVVELCTLVPLLKRHLGNLGLLPRTLTALSFFCRRRRQSQAPTPSLPFR